MIEEVVVLNFKSIKSAQFGCKRINVIIGPPNSGKSNLLEAIGLFSLFNADCKIHHLVRFQTLYNLFHDNSIEENLHIRTDQHQIRIRMKENFEVTVETQLKTSVKSYDLYYDKIGKLLNTNPHYMSPVNSYHFRPADFYESQHPINLKPPFGDNLALMLQKYPDLRKEVSKTFKPYGHKLVVNLVENSLQLQKDKDGLVVTYPYTLSSITLQRYVFYLAAIATNKNSVIVFDEPAFHSTPEQVERFTQYIANDKNNQYFITIHNPGLLRMLMKKVAPEDMKMVTTEFSKGQTLVNSVAENDYQRVLEDIMQ
ncbi:MAG: AAA family ATPase [Bacteroidota bacterium]|nr:AAA family ATPase [Bacteroidota bacterium]